MPSTTCYLMSKSVLTGLNRRHGSVACRVCGERIEEGDAVVSVKNARANIKVCHESCYESLFLDI